jgi:hypothetical protein
MIKTKIAKIKSIISKVIEEEGIYKLRKRRTRTRGFEVDNFKITTEHDDEFLRFEANNCKEFEVNNDYKLKGSYDEEKGLIQFNIDIQEGNELPNYELTIKLDNNNYEILKKNKKFMTG